MTRAARQNDKRLLLTVERKKRFPLMEYFGRDDRLERQ
jgi:hypothetical protein